MVGTGIPYATIVDKHLDCAIMALQSILSAPSSKSCWISWWVSIYTLWFLTSILLQAQEHLLYGPKARAQWILRLALQCPDKVHKSKWKFICIPTSNTERKHRNLPGGLCLPDIDHVKSLHRTDGIQEKRFRNISWLSRASLRSSTAVK